MGPSQIPDRKEVKASSSSTILNLGEPSGISTGQAIDIELTLAMADLKARFIDPDKGAVNYKAIRGSPEFEKYKGLTRELRRFDLHSLKNQGQKLAFWINIYNTAVIHGVIELGIEQSVKERSGFFDRVVYEIGGFLFSLNDIEHGVLRGNRRPPYRLFKPFRGKDGRMDFIVSPFDPKVHFALVCGARSCPPISYYEAEQADFQLQLAAMSFINSAQVKILPEQETVLISKIFQWYKADFGGSRTALIETLLSFLDEGNKKTFLKKKKDRLRIKYQPYDWNLNQ
jgi:hypothetical protein